MTKKLQALILAVALLFHTGPVRADFFGGDLPLLAKQLTELIMLVKYTKASLDLAREVKSGIDDALSMIKRIKHQQEAGIYSDWDNLEKSLRNIEAIYGTVPKTALSKIHKYTDQNIAEAITLARNLHEVAKSYDDSAEMLQKRAMQASPKGAARVTAQGIGVSIQVMNESLRTQASSLKIQAQQLANANQKEKQEAKQFDNTTEQLSKSFKTHSSTFTTPKFTHD